MMENCQHNGYAKSSVFLIHLNYGIPNGIYYLTSSYNKYFKTLFLTHISQQD